MLGFVGAVPAMLLGCVVPLPRAVSIASNLLVSTPVAQSVLDDLRAGGVELLAAVNYDPGEAPAALVESGTLDGILESTFTNEPIASGKFARAAAIEQWIHVCDTVPRLAGARRVGARTIWLNEQAAADENSKGMNGEAGESSGYLARGIIADLADGVCGRFADLPLALKQVQLTEASGRVFFYTVSLAPAAACAAPLVLRAPGGAAGTRACVERCSSPALSTPQDRTLSIGPPASPSHRSQSHPRTPGAGASGIPGELRVRPSRAHRWRKRRRP